MTVLAVAVAIALTALAAVLALIETAFTRVGAVGARAISETNPDRAARLKSLLERPERVLAPVLLLTLACHMTSATLLALVLRDAYGGAGFVMAVAIEILAVFLVSEAVPKAFALGESVTVAARLAPVAGALARLPIIAPFARLLLRVGQRERVAPVVSEGDLIAMAEAAVEAEAIEAEERTLIESVFVFGDTIARNVMVPRPDMVVVHTTDTVASTLGLVVDKGFTRFPVVGDDIDDVVGIVLSKDLLRAHLEGRLEESVTAHLRTAECVPETKRVADLMPEMQARKFHLAIVVDEYGGTAGLVTLENLIEALVGDIVDEFDQELPLVQHLSDDEMLVAGRIPVSELAELVETDLPQGDWDTAGGLVYGLLGHVPDLGEAIVLDGLRVIAEAVDGNRIELLRVVQTARPPEPVS